MDDFENDGFLINHIMVEFRPGCTVAHISVKLDKRGIRLFERMLGPIKEMLDSDWLLPDEDTLPSSPQDGQGE